jgi:diguanylate cyclase (GGDEF)-like protein
VSETQRVTTISARVSAGVALAAGLIAAVVLFGWWNDDVTLVRVMEPFAPMAPATAVGVLLVSAALVLTRTATPGRVRHLAGGALAAVVIALAALVLVEHVQPDWHFLDAILPPPDLAGLLAAGSARPVAEVAVALLLLGAALALLTHAGRRASLMADLLASCAGIVALAGMAALAVDGSGLFDRHGNGPSAGIALPSAVALWLLAVGVLSAHPHNGLPAMAASTGPHGLLMRRLLPILACVPLAVSVLALLIGRTSEISPVTVLSVLGAANVALVVFVLLMAGEHVQRLEAERADAEGRAEHRASYDSLTGLANRGQFLDRLEAATQAQHRRLAVVVADVDNLRSINDGHGDAVGDRVLVAVAERLVASVRPADVVARVGGDEFAVLCEDVTDPGEAGRLAERLARLVRRPVPAPDGEVAVTAGVGVAYTDQLTGATDLLHAAEMALSRAKADGPGGVGRFDVRLREQEGERYQVERDLRRALSRDDELTLHYQPIIDLRDGSVGAVEALLRWQHPERGLLPPARLLEVAAEADLLSHVGRQVIGTAAKQAAAWQHLDLSVYMNLSGVDVGRPDLAERVLGAAERAGCPPRLLGIEVTEQHVMTDPETARVGISELRRAGVSIAIDDFGTGYSSLTYLRRLPVDRLKIDGSLVRGMASDVTVQALVTAAVRMGHALGLTVVGEAVEELGHETTLFELGADLAQGYLYSPALPAADFEAWLADYSERRLRDPASWGAGRAK